METESLGSFGGRRAVAVTSEKKDEQRRERGEKERGGRKGQVGGDHGEKGGEGGKDAGMRGKGMPGRAPRLYVLSVLRTALLVQRGGRDRGVKGKGEMRKEEERTIGYRRQVWSGPAAFPLRRPCALAPLRTRARVPAASAARESGHVCEEETCRGPGVPCWLQGRSSETWGGGTKRRKGGSGADAGASKGTMERDGERKGREDLERVCGGGGVTTRSGNGPSPSERSRCATAGRFAQREAERPRRRDATGALRRAARKNEEEETKRPRDRRGGGEERAKQPQDVESSETWERIDVGKTRGRGTGGAKASCGNGRRQRGEQAREQKQAAMTTRVGKTEVGGERKR